MVSDETEIQPVKNSRFEKIVIAILLIFLLNLIFLNMRVFWPEKESTMISSLIEKEVVQEPAIVTSDSVVAESDLCPEACLEMINQATASGFSQAPIETKTIIQQTGVKEIYIPLGSGSTESMEWVELVGIESVIDMANYPNVKEIIFEASLRIPTANGKMYAKLFNVTDKHDVWFSEVEAEGSSGYRAESAKITLSQGRKVYRVKIKSTMGYEAILDSARIKILLK